MHRGVDEPAARFLLYHFVVLFLGVFPASIFALSSFFKKENDKAGDSSFNLWMQTLFFVVLILFTIVKTKIVHYRNPEFATVMKVIRSLGLKLQVHAG